LWSVERVEGKGQQRKGRRRRCTFLFECFWGCVTFDHRI
jgi:hypothetical protein